MGIVAILDENTINKIAAGEVVDRPASIVKELVENSLDAGATKIEVEIKNGGISLIKVVDNGKGIASDDVKLAFERHATSKIRKESDILKIMSMGFRGEALASIAAIAKVCMETKNANEYTGSKYVIECGKEILFEEIAKTTGTTITIKDVFASVPARFKFLKKDYTEAGYIEEVLTRTALINPTVSIKYINNGKQIFSTVASEDMKNTVFSLFGKDISENIEQVDYEYNQIKVKGVIGTPEIARSSRTNEYTYVNKRYIKDKTITSAIEKAFEQNMLSSKFPFAIINVEIAPETVDVNVHPAKLEVKFENEGQVFEAVYHAVSNAIYAYHNKKSPFTQSTQQSEQHQKENVPTTSFVYKEASPNTHTIMEITDYIMSNKIEESDVKQDYDALIEPEKVDLPQEAPKSILEQKYRYVGNVFNTYIIIQINDTMYIIDQHAAHERILYEEFKNMYYKKNRETQMLLLPILVELRASEMDVFKANQEMFTLAGFVFELFGDSAVKITGIPNVAYDIDAKAMFIDGIDKLMGTEKTDKDEKEARFLYTLACKAAVKANMALSYDEQIALLDNMMKLDKPFTCPHGRPTAYELTRNEIERRFLRK